MLRGPVGGDLIEEADTICEEDIALRLCSALSLAT